MKNKILLYFPYKLGASKSGSSLRPNMIIEAFDNFADSLGKELIIVSGTSKERKEIVKKFDSKLLSEIDYCYFENATLPFWLTDKDKVPRSLFWETTFLKKLSKLDIQIGIFYRDIYWKFKDYYPFRGPKLLIMKAIYTIELKFFDKISNVIFLPSISMNQFCNFKTESIALPPGMNNTSPSINKFENKILFYVGSLNENSGLKDIIKILEIIKKYNFNFKIKLVCPKDDIDKDKEKFNIIINDSNVELMHLYGEELREQYKNSSIAIIPRKVNTYNSFAMPIKLFEYIENGLPIISSNVTETAKFIGSNRIGYVYKNDQELVEIFHKISTPDNYQELLSNINNMKVNNSWDARVLEIDNLLRRKEAK